MTYMERHDARGEAEVLAPLEPRTLHHGLERFLIRMAADRLGEVAVARAVAGEPLAEPGENLKGIEVVARCERAELRLRELEHEQPAARLQDAEEARERALLVRHVAQPEADRHAMEAVRHERQRFGVGEHVVDVARNA